jgi:site-specific recombinase
MKHWYYCHVCQQHKVLHERFNVSFDLSCMIERDHIKGYCGLWKRDGFEHEYGPDLKEEFNASFRDQDNPK